MSDAEIPRKSKKLLLFLSDKNPLWGLVFGRGLGKGATQQRIDRIFRPRSENPNLENDAGSEKGTGRISRWFTKGIVPIDQLDFQLIRDNIATEMAKRYPLLSDRQNSILDKFDAFMMHFENDEITYYQTAILLGVSLNDAQQIIDNTYFNRGPAISSLGYADKTKANNHFEAYRGLYNVWINRYSKWLQCNLRVRYLIEIKDAYLIRCKLNIVRPNDNRHWEYDGFMVVFEDSISWIFERRLGRDETRTDHFYFITDRDQFHFNSFKYPEKYELTIIGQYLTTTSTARQRGIIVSDEIILQRRSHHEGHDIRSDRGPQSDDIDTMEKLMKIDIAELTGEAEDSIKVFSKRIKDSKDGEKREGQSPPQSTEGRDDQRRIKSRLKRQKSTKRKPA